MCTRLFAAINAAAAIPYAVCCMLYAVCCMLYAVLQLALVHLPSFLPSFLRSIGLFPSSPLLLFSSTPQHEERAGRRRTRPGQVSVQDEAPLEPREPISISLVVFRFSVAPASMHQNTQSTLPIVRLSPPGSAQSTRARARGASPRVRQGSNNSHYSCVLEYPDNNLASLFSLYLSISIYSSIYNSSLFFLQRCGVAPADPVNTTSK